MKTSQPNIFQNLKIILLALVLVFSVQYVSAAVWAGPTGSPPASNTDKSIDVSGNPQTKLGGLVVASGAGTNPGFIVNNGNVGIGLFGATLPNKKLEVVGDGATGYVRAAGFCLGGGLGGDCITSWPSGTPGVPIGVNSLSSGDLRITVNPTVGSVVVSNSGNGGTIPKPQVKIFCISNNPPNHNQCPSGWTSAGVFDNGGSSWCTDLITGVFKRWSSDAVLCFKSS
ncbi:MAG: hypothetical protein AAB726_01945 [Patescibacteria group bacterium]